MSEGLPKNLLYTNQPSMPQANRIQHTIKPVNGSTFNPSDIIRINIPCKKGLYLLNDECYMRVTLSNGAVGTRLDGGAFSLFNRWQTFHGSNLLEDVTEYGALYSLLVDATLSSVDRNNVYSHLMGCESDTNRLATVALTGVTAVGITTNIDGQLTGGAGANLTLPVPSLKRRGQDLTANTSYTFCLPIISSIIGTHLPFFTPLSWMQDGGDIRCEITLSSAAQYGIGAANQTFTISNFEFVLTYIELNPTTEEQLKQLYYHKNGGNMIELSTKQYRSFRNTFTTANGASTSVVHLIPARFQSLCQIFGIFRLSAALTDVAQASVTGRGTFFMSQYQFRLGNGQLYPQTPVLGYTYGYSQYLIEALKAIGGVGNLQHSTGIIYNQYNDADGQPDGSFFIGVDLTTCGSDSQGVLYAGQDTRFSNIFLEASFADNAAANNVTADYFCLYDAKIVIVNGVATIVY